jgi:pimeloyl-ACP methyl ester carboxylesterase
MYFFQLPFLPETLLYRALAAGLVRSGQSAERAERDAAGFVGPKALTGPINWYRAMPFIDPRRSGDRVTTPTLLIWSDRDRFVHEKGVRMCEQWVSGPYRVETLSGVSHWIPDEAPARATELIIPRLRAYPVRPAQSGG